MKPSEMKTPEDVMRVFVEYKRKCVDHLKKTKRDDATMRALVNDHCHEWSDDDFDRFMSLTTFIHDEMIQRKFTTLPLTLELGSKFLFLEAVPQFKNINY